MKNTGGSAFPIVDDSQGFVCGMTLRDYFAAAIAGHLQADARDEMDVDWWYSPSRIAERAYAIADAMLKAREK